jgi:hypothetical protein
MGEGGGTGRSHTRWAVGCGKESEARWRQWEPLNAQEQDQGAGNAAAMIRHSLLVAGICKGRVKREWRQPSGPKFILLNALFSHHFSTPVCFS